MWLLSFFWMLLLSVFTSWVLLSLYVERFFLLDTRSLGNTMHLRKTRLVDFIHCNLLTIVLSTHVLKACYCPTWHSRHMDAWPEGDRQMSVNPTVGYVTQTHISTLCNPLLLYTCWEIIIFWFRGPGVSVTGNSAWYKHMAFLYLDCFMSKLE